MTLLTSIGQRRRHQRPLNNTPGRRGWNWTAPGWARCSGFEQRCGCDFNLEIRVFRVIRGQKHDRVLPRIARITPMTRRGYKKVVQYRKESMFSTCCTFRNGLTELRTWHCPVKTERKLQRRRSPHQPASGRPRQLAVSANDYDFEFPEWLQVPQSEHSSRKSTAIPGKWRWYQKTTLNADSLASKSMT